LQQTQTTPLPGFIARLFFGPDPDNGRESDFVTEEDPEAT